MSLNALLVDLLQKLVPERSVYARARRRPASTKEGDLGWAPSSRDELPRR